MTPDDNYFLCNSDNLPIQRQLSKKQKNNFQFLAQFLKSTRKFEQFVKMTTLIAYLHTFVQKAGIFWIAAMFVFEIFGFSSFHISKTS